jgi:chromosome segregation ATPase
MVCYGWVMPSRDEEITQPEVPEVFDADRALRNMSIQVAAIYQTLPAWQTKLEAVAQQQTEHERRIKRLEADVMDLTARIETLEGDLGPARALLARLRADVDALQAA